MTRTRDDDKKWRMFCDQNGCWTQSEQFPTSPPLEMFQDRGWYVAHLSGDICPHCLERGVRPGPNTKPYRGIVPPIMTPEADRAR